MNPPVPGADRAGGAPCARGDEAMNDRLETLIGAFATTVGAASFAVLFTPPWLERIVGALVG